MGIGAATITRPFERLLALIAAFAVLAALLLVFSNPAEAVSNSNEIEHWEAEYPNAKECYKYDPPGKSTVHGSLTPDGKAVVLNTFKDSWPGDHWEVLIVNAANTDIVTPHPIAGNVYAAPAGAEVSHWIVCKGDDPEPAPGKIIVKKEVTDGSNQNQVFTFTETGFTLDDNTLAAGEMGMSGDVEPGGDYSVSETVPDGWTLLPPVCDDANSTPAEINVEEGETVTCTFTNDEIPDEIELGKIIVRKEVTDGSNQNQVFTFTETGFTLDDNTLAAGEMGMSGDVEPGGDYSVSETVPDGWTLLPPVCDDANSTPAEINVEEGETVTCTFVNDEKDTTPRTTPPRTTPPAEPGLIIVKKEVTDESSIDQSFVFTASYDGDGFSLKHGELNQSGDLAAGSYWVSETVPTGWGLVSTCVSTDEADQSTPDAIDLSEGETVTCTFVNDVPETVSPTSIVNTTAPEVSPETLPFTGADSGPHAALALLLVAAGALALVGARVFRADTEE